MKKSILALSLFATLFLLTSGSCKTENDLPSTILMNPGFLAKTKEQLRKRDPKLKEAFDQLIEDADRALQEGPFSVTEKEKLPPSGDKHDYTSYSRYWWPDPGKEDGLPYIRRDGETYPGSQSPKESDRPRIGALGDNTEVLGLAYYFTGKQKYAKKAAELLRVWFLNESTRMNPNLNHGQCRLGHNNGSRSGILDGRLMVKALEGSLLIDGSAELSDDEVKGLKTWASEYFQWLTTKEIALQEAASINNHGSYYDAQAVYFALYAGNDQGAKQIAESFVQNRVLSQIQPDGSMPEEMARTRPLFYSFYNLNAMFLVAHLAEKVGVDIWQSNAPDSRLRTALNYLAPYADPKKKWPTPTLKETDRGELFQILLMASSVYPDGNYLKAIEKIPVEKRKFKRSNLAFPLMR